MMSWALVLSWIQSYFACDRFQRWYFQLFRVVLGIFIFEKFTHPVALRLYACALLNFTFQCTHFKCTYFKCNSLALCQEDQTLERHFRMQFDILNNIKECSLIVQCLVESLLGAQAVQRGRLLSQLCRKRAAPLSHLFSCHICILQVDMHGQTPVPLCSWFQHLSLCTLSCEGFF